MGIISEYIRGWSSPERYIQGPGLFSDIHCYTDKFGSSIAACIDGFLFEALGEKLKAQYQDEKHRLQLFPFTGEVTEQLINERTESLRNSPPDVLVGIGGGKTIDVAKAVSAKLGKPFIIVPTIAATDAPTSSLSVIYNDDGVHVGEYFYDHNPSLLIVDSTIIANAPVRFLVSGMGDALSTWLEASSNRRSGTRNLCYHLDGGCRQTLAGQAVAKQCHDSLMRFGRLAKQACELHVVTDALENIIETNILLSGLGFENNETSAAHSINDGLTAVKNSDKTMHGEKVAFGCIVQLVSETVPEEELEKILAFCVDVGLPVCLEDLQVSSDDETIRTIARASLHSNWKNMPFPINEEFVFAHIKTADAIGKAFKQHYKRSGNDDF